MDLRADTPPRGRAVPIHRGQRGTRRGPRFPAFTKWGNGVTDRIAEIEAQLGQLQRVVASLLNADGRRAVLFSELHAATAGDWFTAGELFRSASDDCLAALQACGINTPRGLSDWLAVHIGYGVERSHRERGGILWRVIREGP